MFLNKKIITEIKSNKTLIGNAEGKKIAEINIMFFSNLIKLFSILLINILFYVMFGGFTVLSGIYIYFIVKKTKQQKKLNNNKLTVEL